MTYLKTLITLATLALLTACAGGVTVNPTVNNGPTAPCVANPFGTTCTNATETQRVTFCRDASKTTDTKTADCAPTVFSVCDANAFDTLCPDDAVKEEAFCRDTAKPTSTKANDCAQIVMTACTDDFFDTICDDIKEYEDERTEFNNMCINEPGKTKEICDMEALARTCGTDPFATGCEAGYAPQRKTTCASEITSTRCIPTVTLFCGTDSKVFDTYCTAPAHVDKRVDLCLTGDTNPLCLGSAGITNTFCTANPFDPRAGCAADAYNMTRQTACESGDKDRKECEATVLLICDVPNGFREDFCRGLMRYDDLLEIANNTPDPCADGACVDFADLPALLTAPEEKATPTTDFADGALSVTLIPPTDGTPLLNPDGTDNTTISTTAFPTGTVVREGVANLRFRRRGGRGSSDADGFVTFRLLKANADDSVSESVRVSTHGAILPTTNLGAPLTDAPATAVWPGHFYNGRETYSTDFYIMFEAGLPNNQIGKIDFAKPDGTGIATVAADRPEFTKGQFSITFAVTFDAKGVLSGNIQAGFDPSNVLGLIGTEGVVGVGFGGEDPVGFTATNPDGGAVPVVDRCIAGLVADNCVNTAAWLASFEGGNALPTTPDIATQAPTRKNQFLQATATGFASGANTDIRATFGGPQTDIAIKTRTFANTDTATGGFAYFGGELYSGEAGSETGTRTYFYYAGVLAGTNLGAPITAPIISARWMGQIRADSTDNNGVLTANPAAGFGLNITFDGAEGTMKSIFEVGVGFYYEMDGTFNDKGIIEGTVALGYSTTGTGDNRVLTTSHTFYSPGTLRGIIGQNGAVGVFHSDNANAATKYRFSGGFVATPPAPSP